jgi:hypothetical protein
MPRGFEGVKKASAEVEARRGSGGPGALWFRLQAGEEAIGRFLEQDGDVVWAMVHEVPVEGRSWGRDVPCLDQEKDGTPCPGCEADLPRKFKGYINVIWDNAPVFHRDEQGKLVKDKQNNPVITGHKPQVAVWSSGIRLFDNLGEINDSYKGLRSRRFRIKRKGEGLSTTYVINPEDPDSGPQPFSKEETKLEEDKYDLSDFVKPPSYEDFMNDLNGLPRGTPQSNEDAGRANPFMRNS